MKKEIIGVDPDRVFGLQKDYSEKAHIAMNANDEQFFDAVEALLKANFQQKEAFIEEVLKRKSSTGSFIVGEVLQHRNKDLVPVWMGDNFKNWLWNPAQHRTVSVSAFGKNLVKEYVLPKDMNDTAIQTNTNSTPMLEDVFWAILFLLIINPKLGKKILKYKLRKDKVYIFHVQLSDLVVAVNLYWDDDEWDLNACDFGCGDPWSGGGVFLFPATA